MISKKLGERYQIFQFNRDRIWVSLKKPADADTKIAEKVLEVAKKF